MADRSEHTDTGSSFQEPSSTSSGLLEKAKQQDPEGWERLVHKYGLLIYFWCRLHRLQPADAHDVMQEVFHGVLGGIKQFRRDQPGQGFRRWLWTITRNKIANHYHRKGIHPQATGGTDALKRQQEIPAGEPVSAADSSIGTAVGP